MCSSWANTHTVPHLNPSVPAVLQVSRKTFSAICAVSNIPSELRMSFSPRASSPGSMFYNTANETALHTARNLQYLWQNGDLLH